MAIPKIIHQTWKQAAIPEEYKSYVNSVRKHNPGHKYRLWTDTDNRELIRTQYPWFLHIYDGYRHAIERADAVRYFILYTYGGVYIDLDMECLRAIESLLAEADVFLSLEAGPEIGNQVISNAFMASAPGHPFFLKIITGLATNTRDDITFADVFSITGPDMVARMYQQYSGSYNFRIISLDDICPRGVLDQHPRFGSRTLQHIRDDKLLTLVHHNTESWNIQLNCPNLEIEGYTLFKHQDINGFDIDYVEYTDSSLDAIVSTCSRHDQAIAFNYNGYIKGPGGKLQTVEKDCFWLKEGIEPWIYVKSAYTKLVI